MANGDVESHNRLPSISDSNHNPTSDPERVEDTMEYRVMMAYTTRRHPKQKAVRHKQDKPGSENGGGKANGTAAAQKPVEAGKVKTTEERKKKKKKKKGLKFLALFRCVKPQTEDDEETPQDQPGNGVSSRCFEPTDEDEDGDSVKDEEDLVNVVNQLIGISDDIQFVPVSPEIEEDSPENSSVEKVIGLILRDSGDKLNEEMEKENITPDLFLKYDFFKDVITTLLNMIGFTRSDPNALGPQASPKTQIAATCEVTSRLSAVDILPTAVLLQHGARYLQEFYSPWVQQHGGYEAAIESDEEVD